MVDELVDDRRFFLADQICELLRTHQAQHNEAREAVRLVIDLIRPSGLAIVRSLRTDQEHEEEQGAQEGALTAG